MVVFPIPGGAISAWKPTPHSMPKMRDELASACVLLAYK